MNWIRRWMRAIRIAKMILRGDFKSFHLRGCECAVCHYSYPDKSRIFVWEAIAPDKIRRVA